MSFVSDEVVIPSEKDNIRQQIRMAVRGAYDLQKMRIQSGNRLIATFRVKLGLGPNDPEKDDKEAKKIMDNLRLCYEKITDGVKVTLKKFKGEGIISNYTEYAIMDNYIWLEKTEEEAFKKLKYIVESHPLWDGFLKDLKGCGHMMAAVIISEFDIYKAKYASQFHTYAGLDVVLVEDDTGEVFGVGRCKRKELMKEVEYTDSEGNLATRKSLGYNPFLKSKLVEVLADCIIKSKGEWYNVYLGYKNRLTNSVEHQSKTPAHRNRMAKRYMIKQLLIKLHTKWREIEGLEVAPPYHEAKLGIVHTGDTPTAPVVPEFVPKPKQVIKVSGKFRTFTVE